MLSTADENTTVNILSPKVKLDSAQYECVSKSPAAWAVSHTTVRVVTKEEHVKGLRLFDWLNHRPIFQ